MLPTDPLAPFVNDEEGSVAITVSLLLIVLLGFVALGVDVASLYRERAQLQSVSDLTAMSAMAAPQDAVNRANYVLARNAKSLESLETMQTGRFLRNPAVAPKDRFTVLPEGSKGINAVRVVLQDDAPIHFARIFTDDNHVALDRTALATRTGAASFSLNSHLVSLDMAALNQALALRFGAGASFSVADMNVLSEATVDLGALLAALDAQIGGADRNPAEVLNSTASVDDLISTLQSILPLSTAYRLETLATVSGSDTVAVSALVGGIDTDLGLTATEFVSQIELSALDVIKALIASDAAEEWIALEGDVAVPGVIHASTTLTAGEPPAQSGWIALGEEGVQLHRAALRLRTDVAVETDILGNLGVGVQVARVDLPIYIELAGSTAMLDQIGCNIADSQDVAARFLTAHTPLHPANGTSVAALYLGELAVDASATDPIDPSDLGFADLLDLDIVIDLPLLPDVTISGLTIPARSNVGVGASQQDTITFNHDDVTNDRTTKSFESGDLLATAITDLLSPQKLELRVKPGQQGLVSGLVAPVVAGLLDLLPARLLSGLSGPVDDVLDSTLAGLGLELGSGELTLTGHHCEPIRLVR